ncbi:hypothetical protein VTJ49DRAFT_7150 [Mycothermus thermophilus]|uniref:Uncharacterized protein n=1 Tax=Humicola insolens TaxID=85995 RepID=A0ABR3VHH8_HUMIN
MAAKTPLLIIIPIACNYIALLLVCMVLFGGFNGSLLQVHWLKITITDFSLPPITASSTYLAALTTFTNTDYIGTPLSSTSLNLPSSTTTHLLTECATYPSGAIDCAPPSYGFRFSPSRHLNLGATSLTLSGGDLTSSLTAYARASRWMSAAFIFSAISFLLTPVEALLISRAWAAFSSGLTSLVLLAGTIAGGAVGARVARAFNDRLSEQNGVMTASLGAAPIALGVVGSVLAVVACVVYVAAHRVMKRRNARVESSLFGDVKFDGGGSEYHGAAAVVAAEAGKSGLFPSVTRRHKYVQIGQQGKLAQLQEQERLQQLQQQQQHRSRSSSPDLNPPRRPDEDWAAPDEYTRAGAGAVRSAPGPEGVKTSSGPSAGIPLVALGANRPTRDLNTAYEPYSNPQ